MPDATKNRRKRIMVVDDEPAVLAITANILTRYGYEVWSATSGAQALEMCRGAEAQITLLLADVVMPSMTGPELAERLMAIYPAMHVLFMSGWDEGVIGRYGAFRRNIRTIVKPFAPDGLVEMVETTLQEPVGQT